MVACQRLLLLFISLVFPALKQSEYDRKIFHGQHLQQT